MKPTKFKLTDVSDGEHANETVNGQVSLERDNLALLIAVEGYACHDSPDEFGADSAVVLLERHGGELRLIVWGDINSSDPTHIISLEGAEVKRRDWVQDHVSRAK